MIAAASFFSGIAMASFLAAGVFFIRFWRRSRDPFFSGFAWACWLLALERAVSMILFTAFHIETGSEAGVWTYVIRLAAFIILFRAIYHKNRSSSRS